MSKVRSLRFADVVRTLKAIESTTQRTVMVRLLANLFKEAPPEAIDKIVYLVLGELRPEWENVELGVGEKLTIRALASAAGIPSKEVEAMYKRLGDIGEVAKRALELKSSRLERASILSYMSAAKKESLTVDKVYDTLLRIARTTGDGSQDVKVRLLSSLLSEAEPEEAKYIARFVVGKMRLGIADMTVLDALSEVFKVKREILERAYHVCPDLGLIAKQLALKGVSALAEIKVRPGVPVQPMLAERLTSASEILSKLDGVALCEFKYDGERAQIHKFNNTIKIFSRRLEDITHAYPDVVKYINDAISAKEFIVEGEIVAYDPETGELKAFQELMHRRRKHDVLKAAQEYPVKIYLFDIIYIDGEDLSQAPLLERRRRLVEILSPTDYVQLANWRLVSEVSKLEEFFYEAISSNCEGIICKSVKADAVYGMGARGWLWIKYKRDYRSELMDTLDLVVVGAFYGRGKRAGTYGALLMAAYDPDTDKFYTTCKVGSGFVDEDLAKIPQILDQYRIPHKHPRVVSKLEADVWFVPSVVLEIIGAEITLSPVHTCAMGLVRPDVGLAIRFPRFTGRYRFDKKPEQATTVKEIYEMYLRQRKVKVVEDVKT